MKVTLELSDLVVVMQYKHTMSRIFHKNLEDNNEEEKEPINIEISQQKTDPYNDENTIDSK